MWWGPVSGGVNEKLFGVENFPHKLLSIKICHVRRLQFYSLVVWIGWSVKIYSGKRQRPKTIRIESYLYLRHYPRLRRLFIPTLPLIIY